MKAEIIQHLLYAVNCFCDNGVGRLLALQPPLAVMLRIAGGPLSRKKNAGPACQPWLADGNL